MKIGNKNIGPGNPCFVVAELSGNHHQKYEEAAELVRAAAAAGADAVKLQTYTPDTITLNSDKEWFRVGGEDNPESWRGKTLYQLYQVAYTPWDWQPKLKTLADNLEIILFSTPFDETAVDFLEAMEVPCYKISSYEITDIPLLRKVGRTGKPVIVSVGYASKEEVASAVKTLRENGCKELALLHCVTGYSDQPRLEDMHLKTIADLRNEFSAISGFSDNNAGIEIPIFAEKSGASIIEKHFILDKNSSGPDARFSIDPEELYRLVKAVKKQENYPFIESDFQKALGSQAHYGPVNKIEEYNKRWRRSLFIGKDMKKGEVFTKDNVRDVRPAFGLETKYLDEVIGKHAAQDIEFGTPLSWELIIK